MIHITTPLSLLFRSYLPGTGRTAITTLLVFADFAIFLTIRENKTSKKLPISIIIVEKRFNREHWTPRTACTVRNPDLCFFRRGDCVRAIPWTHQTWINVAVFRYFPIIRVYSQLNKLNKLRLYTTCWAKQQSTTICKSSLRSGHVFYPFSASKKSTFGQYLFFKHKTVCFRR